jgi:hypothetical protein
MNRRFFFQCILIFILTLISDIIAAVHIIALVDSAMFLSVVTIILAHYLSSVGYASFADEKGLIKRFWITTASAVGAAIGTIIVILWFPKH